MIKGLLISFGSLVLMCFAAQMGMKLVPRFFKDKSKQDSKKK